MSKMKEHLAKLDYFDGVKAENKRICEALKAELLEIDVNYEEPAYYAGYMEAQQDMLKWFNKILKEE